LGKSNTNDHHNQEENYQILVIHVAHNFKPWL